MDVNVGGPCACPISNFLRTASGPVGPARLRTGSSHAAQMHYDIRAAAPAPPHPPLPFPLTCNAIEAHRNTASLLHTGALHHQPGAAATAKRASTLPPCNSC